MKNKIKEVIGDTVDIVVDSLPYTGMAILGTVVVAMDVARAACWLTVYTAAAVYVFEHYDTLQTMIHMVV